MIEVDFTAGGWTDLAGLRPNDRLDVIFKLQFVEQNGLGGEQKIGQISPPVQIYLLFSGNHHVVGTDDSRASPRTFRVFAIEAYALIDFARKVNFLNAAVRAIGTASGIIVYE